MSTSVFFFGMILLSISNLQTQTIETTAYSNQLDLQTDHTSNLIPELKLEKVDTKVEIGWQTIGDVKGVYYEIQRSKNKIKFETIVMVPAGYASSNNTYNYLDEKPSTENYYRLKVIDNSGKVYFSEEQYLRFENTINSIVNSIENSEDAIEVKYQLKKNSPVKITLVNNKGTIISTYFAKGVEGENILHLPSSKITDGTYQLIMNIDDTEIFRNVLINKATN